jgi:hypothetical protein
MQKNLDSPEPSTHGPSRHGQTVESMSGFGGNAEARAHEALAEPDAIDPERTWEPARGAGSLPTRRRAESFDEKIKENAQLGEAVASGRIDR